MVLALFTGALVYKVGIFEGLILAMAVHVAMYLYMVYTQVEKQPVELIISNYLGSLKRVSPVE